MKTANLFIKWLFMAIFSSIITLSCSTDELSSDTQESQQKEKQQSKEDLKSYLESKIYEIRNLETSLTEKASEAIEKFYEINWNDPSIPSIQELEAFKNRKLIARVPDPEPVSDVQGIESLESEKLKSYIRNLSPSIRETILDNIDIIIKAETKGTYSEVFNNQYATEYLSSYYLMTSIKAELFNLYTEALIVCIGKISEAIASNSASGWNNFSTASSNFSKVANRYANFIESRSYTDYTSDIKAYDTRVIDLFIKKRIRFKVEGDHSLFDVTEIKFYLGFPKKNDDSIHDNYSDEIILKKKFEITNPTGYHYLNIIKDFELIQFRFNSKNNPVNFTLEGHDARNDKLINISTKSFRDLLCEPVITYKHWAFGVRMTMKMECGYTPF